MNIRPLQDRIVAKRIEKTEEVRGGIIIPDTAKEKPQEAEVVAVGPGKLDDNGNRSKGGVSINNATLVNNNKNGNPVQIQLNDGRPHKIRNSIAFDVDGANVTEFTAEVVHEFNSWNGRGVSASDFKSPDIKQLMKDAMGPRNADGILPAIGLRLDRRSRLIDAGADVGLPFRGKAPDLGAFEVK